MQTQTNLLPKSEIMWLLCMAGENSFDRNMFSQSSWEDSGESTEKAVVLGKV